MNYCPSPPPMEKRGLCDCLSPFDLLFAYPSVWTKLCGCCNSATTGPIQSKWRSSELSWPANKQLMFICPLDPWNLLHRPGDPPVICLNLLKERKTQFQPETFHNKHLYYKPNFDNVIKDTECCVYELFYTEFLSADFHIDCLAITGHLNILFGFWCLNEPFVVYSILILC